MAWTVASRGLLARALAIWLGLVSPLLSEQLAKRLILKDGSYQLVSKWEVKGERVRYFSAERAEWEEVPNNLVDWTATEQFQKDRDARGSLPNSVALERESEAERTRQQARSPLVSPGLRLPSEATVVLFDQFKSQPQLAELEQSGAEITRRPSKSVLHGAINPVEGSRQNIELEGAHARVQAHLSRPAIYVNIDSGGDDSPSPEPAERPARPAADSPRDFRLVRLGARAGRRVVGEIKIGLSGTPTEQEEVVAVDTQPLTGGWVKLTPRADLALGEYAVVEMLGKEGMNTQVWDFGVNPAAAANPSAISSPTSPEEPGAAPPGKAQSD
jgi:hypothetical protein